MQFRTFSVIACIFVASCKGFVPDALDTGNLHFVEPFQDWRNGRGECVEGQTCWSEMDQDMIRELISLRDSSSAVFKDNENGTLTHLGISAEVGRGKYRVEQYFMAYLNQPCLPDQPSLGMQRTGVGVRVIADITSRVKKLNLGGLLPLAAAAEKGIVTGRIQVRTWGIHSSNRTVARLLSNSTAPLNEEGVKTAIGKLELSEKILDDPDTKLNPWTFAVVESAPGSCQDKT
ncbi:MAG: hypothetical protein ACK5II_07495 [Paracoccus sp. (in: a-proteobacteria)]